MRTLVAMELSARKINWFTLFKLPMVFLAGIRVRELTDTHCTVHVRHRWINQNPFHSMFWAVQGMASELSTGALVMQATQNTGKPFSMLLINTKASFHKKAKGRIRFTCEEGSRIRSIVNQSLQSGEGESFWLSSIGIDEMGDSVSEFQFEWSVKPKL